MARTILTTSRSLYLPLLIIGILTVLSSCEDFFDETPGDKMLPEDHYNTAVEINVSYLGAFALLQDAAANLVITNGLLGDLMMVTENAGEDLTDINNHIISESNPYVDASNLYKVIINANEVLANSNTTISDPDFTILNYNKVYGDLVGLRSWAYFTLAKLYNEVAYIPDNLETMPSEPGLQYLTKEAIIDTLIHDLDSLVLAADKFDIETDLDVAQYRINNHALLGEIYLELDSFQLAADYLYEATNTGLGSDYKVTSTYAEEKWENIFINSSGRQSTVMSVVPYSINNQQFNIIEQLTNYRDDYALQPSNFIISMFDNQINKVENSEPGDIYRGKGTSFDIVAGFPVIYKYNLNEAQEHSADIILYRAADIHLMLAEALNRLGQSEEAIKILNQGYRDLPSWSMNEGIRGRVALVDLAPGDGSIEYTENMIMSERAMELAFEGKRWFDLMRIARRRNDNSYLANFVSNKFSDPEMKQEIKDLLMDEDNWFLPTKY